MVLDPSLYLLSKPSNNAINQTRYKYSSCLQEFLERTWRGVFLKIGQYVFQTVAGLIVKEHHRAFRHLVGLHQEFVLDKRKF